MPKPSRGRRLVSASLVLAVAIAGCDRAHPPASATDTIAAATPRAEAVLPAGAGIPPSPLRTPIVVERCPGYTCVDVGRPHLAQSELVLVAMPTGVAETVATIPAGATVRLLGVEKHVYAYGLAVVERDGNNPPSIVTGDTVEVTGNVDEGGDEVIKDGVTGQVGWLKRIREPEVRTWSLVRDSVSGKQGWIRSGNISCSADCKY